MAKYLWQVSYTSDGLRGALKDGRDRASAAIEELSKSVGETVEMRGRRREADAPGR